MRKSGPEIAQSGISLTVAEKQGATILNFPYKDNNRAQAALRTEGLIKIAVDKKSFLYLVGTTLDYSGGLNGKGFVFINPNANRTCGCGESFAL